ncbi:hypothetical protein GUITHDRAFT_161831 [Guillardia theta CCMP2712]|uniref:Methyltransferase domain-containing protein n=1 Tax=Guillardia theta (strain CCMP2712) TaxID=905079 RepID=L1JPR6_GUITC|nr:hypothetical protein GUITHDRAFT_161831 [Guillardia theta CCMP2712]EKX50586.1 hypothetical protein GUITHDRAFT_161831 [Guillardia theta CCMP2712]|eukprot:XP_005837566.1 hypothetical protein GUITHDRAFT_161831 [Guillardia theta CCMP2712]
MIEAIKRTGVGSSDRILDVGCGSSRLIWDLCDEGYTRVIGIDFSPVVIKKLQAEREQCAGAKEQTLHLFHMDAAALAFSDASIALVRSPLLFTRSSHTRQVVDKGLLDSVLAVHDRRELWKRSGKKEAQDPFLKRAAREAEEKGRKVLVELRRILKSDGVYLVVSYEEPTYRMPFLRQASAEGEQLWREMVSLHVQSLKMPTQGSSTIRRFRSDHLSQPCGYGRSETGGSPVQKRRRCVRAPLSDSGLKP